MVFIGSQVSLHLLLSIYFKVKLTGFTFDTMLINANDQPILILMSSGLTEKNNREETVFHSNRNATERSSGIEASRKIVDIINSLEVQVKKEEDGNDFIDIDFENLAEGKFYRVEYQGDVYSNVSLTLRTFVTSNKECRGTLWSIGSVKLLY